MRAAWARACRLGANDLAIAVVCVKLCPLTPSFERDMPAAKKPTTRTPPARSRNGTPTASRAATRRDVERQVTRVEKLLGDAGDALQLLAKDMGRGAEDAYQELVRTAKALRRDAERTNKRMLKDFDKLRGALTPSGATRRSSSTTATAGRARKANASSAPAATRSARARTVASSEPSTEARRSRGTAGAASSTRTTRASRSQGTRTAAGSKRTTGAARGRARSNPKPTAG